MHEFVERVFASHICCLFAYQIKKSSHDSYNNSEAISDSIQTYILLAFPDIFRMTKKYRNVSNPKPGHPMGGEERTRRGTARPGDARRVWAERGEARQRRARRGVARLGRDGGWAEPSRQVASDFQNGKDRSWTPLRKHKRIIST